MTKIWRKLRWVLGWLRRRTGVYSWRICFGEKDLREPIPEVHSPLDLEVVVASPDCLRKIEARLDGEDKQDFQDGMESGDICYVAKSNGEIAGYSWVNLQTIEMAFGTIVQYPPDAVYLHTSLVFPEARGKKVFQYLSWKIYLDLENRGYRYACNLTFADNAPSLAARRNLNVKFKTLRFLKLPWMKLMVFGRPRFVLTRKNRD